MSPISHTMSPSRSWTHVHEQVDQVGPVQNTWYPICNVNDAILTSISVYVMTVGETLECRITIDGEVWDGQTIAANAGTAYQVVMTRNGNVLYLYYVAGAATPAPDYYMGIRGQSIVVEVRKTTANGAGQLRACVIGSRLV